MKFDSLFDRGERTRKRFVVYTDEDDHPATDRFTATNATVERRCCPTEGEDGFVVVRTDDRFLGAISISELRRMFESPVVTPWDLDDEHEKHRELFGLLDDTQFDSLDDRRVLLAGREIEEHAWRVGAGTLHVGLRSVDTFEDQRSVYERLADETVLDVHVYATTAPEDLPRKITFHTGPEDVVERYRFVLYDGSGDEARKCALVARETGGSEYTGFWTYHPETVDDALAAVASSGG